EDRIALPLEHDVERLEERQARPQQRGQLLAEEHEEVARHLPPPREAGEAEAAADREEIEALLLEIGAERYLVGSRERALHDLSRRRADLADVFHEAFADVATRHCSSEQAKVQVMNDL